VTIQGPPMISARAYGASVSFGEAIYTLGGMEFMNQSFQTSKMQVNLTEFSLLYSIISIKSLISCPFGHLWVNMSKIYSALLALCTSYCDVL